MLDAVYFLCLTKSNLFATDQQSVRFGSDFLRVEGIFDIEGGQEHVVGRFQQGKRKEFFVNEVPYTKLSQHIGRFPCMMISPADAEIIIGGSEARRKLLDSTLAQTDGAYLEALVMYNKILLQRNAALKQFAERGYFDHSLLQVYDEKMIPLGEQIFQKRKAALEVIQPIFLSLYEWISLNRDSVTLQYSAQLISKSFGELLMESRQKDLMLQRTDAGVHKDDFDILINQVSGKKFGSQGQQKSILIALKLAMFQYIRIQKGFAPVLLVDDIFDKLDADRSASLIDLLSGDNTGQVILTHTRKDDFPNHTNVNVLAIEELTHI